MSDAKRPPSEHYDAVAGEYHRQYEREALLDPSRKYPANYFRLQLLLNAFVNSGLRRVIEVGVGEGTPLATLSRAGIDVWGFDISPEMVSRSRARMQELGLGPERVFWGDIQDPTSYVHSLKDGPFDGLMAMGVMPHVENDAMVLRNMATLVREGGRVFIEFRNMLFSLFTFNRLTHDFVVNDLLRGVDQTVRERVSQDLRDRLRMDQPAERRTVADGKSPGYDAVLSRFHNPFEIVELFERHRFRDVQLHWYHYHPAPPYLEADLPEQFRREAARLEHEPSGWRGYFLCSAFVVEAVRGV